MFVSDGKFCAAREFALRARLARQCPFRLRCTFAIRRLKTTDMRWSNFFIPTLREVPADAEVVSHRLLLRAGMVRQLAAGIYSYLPLSWLIMRKIMRIVREEMNAVGGQEFFLP